MLYLFQGVGIVVDLDDIVSVDAVDRSVCALTDDLTSFDRNDPVGLVDLHHLRESSHIENFVDLRTRIDDVDVGVCFSQSQNDAKSRTGNVLQVLRIDQHRESFCILGDDLLNFLFDGRSVP